MAFSRKAYALVAEVIRNVPDGSIGDTDAETTGAIKCRKHIACKLASGFLAEYSAFNESQFLADCDVILPALPPAGERLSEKQADNISSRLWRAR